MRIAFINQRWGAGAARCVMDLHDRLGARHEVLYFPREGAQETPLTILEALKAFQPDVVNCHSYYGEQPYSLLAEISRRYPVCYTVHDPRPIGTMEVVCWNCERNSTCLRCPLVRTRWQKIFQNPFFAQRLGKRITHLRCGGDMQVVAPSRWLAERLGQQELRRFQIHAIPNGVDLDHFKPRAPEHERFGLPRDATILLHVAWHLGWQVNDRKGLPLLAEAFIQHISPRYPNAILAVAGENFVPNHPQVRPLGMVDQKDLPYLLAASDIYISATLADNLPYTVTEAMAAGKAVVASKVGGIPEQVVDGLNGRLVPLKDAGALASAILDLIGDPELLSAYGKAGRKRAEQLFGMDAFISAYENLFQNMVAVGQSQSQSHD
jgi:glycosyltransferase involved in cell wall biosynthesis